VLKSHGHYYKTTMYPMYRKKFIIFVLKDIDLILNIKKFSLMN